MRKIVVIIVSYQGVALLPQCIESLLRASIPEEAVVVVDNGSRDHTVRVLRDRFKGVTVIPLDRNHGYAVACNVGMLATDSEYVLLVNNDATVSSDFLHGLLSCMDSDPSISAVQSTILTYDSPPRIDSLGSFITRTGFLYHDRFGTTYTKSDGDALCWNVFSAKGACLLLRRSALMKVGLLDEDFFLYFEETDLCWRMRLHGFKVKVSGSSLAYHLSGATSRLLPSSFVVYHSFRNRITSMIKNLEFRSLLSVLPLHILISLLLSVTYAIRGKADCGAAILKGILWNVRNLDSTKKKRATTQRLRVISDRDLFRQSSMGLKLRKLVDFGKVYFEAWH